MRRTPCDPKATLGLMPILPGIPSCLAIAATRGIPILVAVCTAAPLSECDGVLHLDRTSISSVRVRRPTVVVSQWSHAQIFYSARRFEYFSRNQRIQRTARSLSGSKSSLFKQLASTSRPARRCWQRFSANYFPQHGRGWSKVWDLRMRDRKAPPQIREIRKTFFHEAHACLWRQSVLSNRNGRRSACDPTSIEERTMPSAGRGRPAYVRSSPRDANH